MENHSENYIYANQITKNYKDPASDVYFQALRGIDLVIKKGVFSSIIGPSGAGKSTLLNILGGNVKPSTGTLTVDSLPIHTLRNSSLDYFRRKIVGFLWQLPERNLLPSLTAFDNVKFSMYTSNLTRSKRNNLAKELLTSVGLKNRMDHKLGQLSGGEAQRASLAVALSNEPQILLADEPTGELDTETTLEIISYLREMNRDRGLTTIVVTHDTRFERLTDQSHYILDGTIAGLRRTVNGHEVTDWKSVEREEISSVNQFGLVRIPEHLREKYLIGDYVKFLEDEDSGCICIKPVEHK